MTNTPSQLREILEDLVMGTLGKRQPKFTETGSLSDYEQAITAHINQAVLQARIDELQALPRYGKLQNKDYVYTSDIIDRTTELTAQLEQEQSK